MSEPRRILCIQLRRIGDVILTAPAVAALKKRFPQAAIDFLVEPPSAEVVRAMPEVRETLVYEAGAWSEIRRVRARRYDLVVDFMGNPRTAILTAFSGAAMKAGPAHVAHRWAYRLLLPQSSSTVYAAREKIRMLAPLGVPDDASALPAIPAWTSAGRPENVVGFFPASRKTTRQWPAAHYAALGRMLRERYRCGVVVFWGPGERPLAEEIARSIGEGAEVSTPTSSLAELAGQLNRCRLVVTNCAGPKHVAVAAGVPTLTVHGSSDPLAWTPSGLPRHAAVRRDELHCIGCMSNSCRYALECLEGLSPERVFDAAAKLLGEVPA